MGNKLMKKGIIFLFKENFIIDKLIMLNTVDGTKNANILGNMGVSHSIRTVKELHHPNCSVKKRTKILVKSI